jgi:hypothetical protein
MSHVLRVRPGTPTGGQRRMRRPAATMRLAPVLLVVLLAAGGAAAKRLPRPVDRKRLVSAPVCLLCRPAAAAAVAACRCQAACRPGRRTSTLPRTTAPTAAPPTPTHRHQQVDQLPSPLWTSSREVIWEGVGNPLTLDGAFADPDPSAAPPLPVPRAPAGGGRGRVHGAGGKVGAAAAAFNPILDVSGRVFGVGGWGVRVAGAPKEAAPLPGVSHCRRMAAPPRRSPARPAPALC